MNTFLNCLFLIVPGFSDGREPVATAVIEVATASSFSNAEYQATVSKVQSRGKTIEFEYTLHRRALHGRWVLGGFITLRVRCCSGDGRQIDTFQQFLCLDREFTQRTTNMMVAKVSVPAPLGTKTITTEVVNWGLPTPSIQVVRGPLPRSDR